jgi:hypothetical protein
MPASSNKVVSHVAAVTTLLIAPPLNTEPVPLVGIGEPIYVGPYARFMPVANGVILQVQNQGGFWIQQERWNED